MSLAEGDCSPGRCPSVLGKKPAQRPVGAPVRHPLAVAGANLL